MKNNRLTKSESRKEIIAFRISCEEKSELKNFEQNILKQIGFSNLGEFCRFFLMLVSRNPILLSIINQQNARTN